MLLSSIDLFLVFIFQYKHKSRGYGSIKLDMWDHLISHIGDFFQQKNPCYLCYAIVTVLKIINIIMEKAF